MSIAVSAQDVKALRDRTGAGMMDSKKALQEAEGDLDKAIEILRVKGQASAAKRGGRATSEGVVSSYIHAGGKIGALVEVDCETDFVARTEAFQEFAREVALHVAAAPDLGFVSEDEVDEDWKEAELRVLREQAAGEGKPENVQEKIVEGRLKKRLEEVVLLNQRHVNEEKHESKTLEELRAELASNTGENIVDPALREVPGRRGVKPAFQRILLKLSGEALMGDLPYGADPERIEAIAREVKATHDRGVEIAVVVGGGNIYRGLKGAAAGMDRATGDYMGMLATVLNALALQDALEKIGRAHARAVGHHDLRGGRALHPPAGHAPPGEGPHRDLRRGHRQSVLHHRHRRGPPSPGDPRRGAADGQERRRGRVLGGPPNQPRRPLHRGDLPRRGDRAAAGGHGLHRALAVHGQFAPDSRVQHGRRGKHRPDSVRRASGDGGEDSRR